MVINRRKISKDVNQAMTVNLENDTVTNRLKKYPFSKKEDLTISKNRDLIECENYLTISLISYDN